MLPWLWWLLLLESSMVPTNPHRDRDCYIVQAALEPTEIHVLLGLCYILEVLGTAPGPWCMLGHVPNPGSIISVTISRHKEKNLRQHLGGTAVLLLLVCQKKKKKQFCAVRTKMSRPTGCPSLGHTTLSRGSQDPSRNELWVWADFDTCLCDAGSVTRNFKVTQN